MTNCLWLNSLKIGIKAFFAVPMLILKHDFSLLHGSQKKLLNK